MPRLVIHANITFKPELAEQAAEITKQTMLTSLKEPGTEYYVVTRSKEETNKFRVFEIYKSEEAFEAHNAGEGFGNLMKWVKENDAIVAFGLEKHELLEDAEKGIVV